MRPPQDWNRARVTLALSAMIVIMWLVAEIFDLHVELAIRAGFIPARIGIGNDLTVIPDWLTPLTSSFLHVSLVAVIFHVLILLFTGRAVEAVVGPVGLAVLYVVGAYAAAAGDYLYNPDDMMPMLGASGAVPAVLAAYAMLFGRIRSTIKNWTLAVWSNALWLAAAWIGLQLLIRIISGEAGAATSIAAHVCGFLAGLALARPLLRFRYRNA